MIEVVPGPTAATSPSAAAALGALNLTGGAVHAGGETGAGTVNLDVSAGCSGTLNLGWGGAVGQLNAATVTGGSGAAVVNFNHTGSFVFEKKLTGSLTVNKLGPGVTTLSGANTYTGGTNLTEGTLLMGASNVMPNTSALSLSAGVTFKSGGFSDTIGPLSVTGAAVMDLGSSAGSALAFSGVGAWAGLLSVWNYTGAPRTQGTDKLIFASGSSAINLANVQFYSDNGVTQIGTGGGLIGNELVPVPEPGAVVSGGLAGTVAAPGSLRRLAAGSRLLACPSVQLWLDGPLQESPLAGDGA